MRYARVQLLSDSGLPLDAYAYQEIDWQNKVTRLADEQGQTLPFDTPCEATQWTGTPTYALPVPSPALEPPPPPPPITKLSRFAFRARFTATEKIAIELAALDNPSASLEQRQQSAMLRVFIKDMETASYVDVTRQDTIAGVTALEQLGLLAAGRAAQILSLPVLDDEAWEG